MPWKETDPMRERQHFITLYQSGLYCMSELCERFGISRKSGYKWLQRYQQSGLSGLLEKSRAPHHCPHRMPQDVATALLEAKRAHPSWGPRKIVPYLAERHPELALPAPSSAGELFRAAGLTQPRRRRRKHPPSDPLSQAQAPNEVWSADFKGEFRTRDGRLCYPLTVADVFSRYLLGCRAQRSTRQAEARPALERLFQEYGLPAAMRTDNGVPFATQAFAGLSALSVWWIKLGIRLQRIEPGRPEQNGRHERMHRTLKAETTRPPEADLDAQQVRFDRFQREYNQERPHEALGQQTPASWYRPSERRLPAKLPEPVYPAHCEVRWVGHGGTFRFKGHQVFLSETLYRERIALEESEEGIWSIYFYEVLLARLDERTFQVSG